MKTSSLLAVLALALSPALSAPTLACSKAGAKPEVSARTTYHAVGVVKSFGPGRVFVNIAHEDIAGYMKAMTMSFEPERPGQLDALSEKDHVDFEFVETEDARRVLTRIDKR